MDKAKNQFYICFKYSFVTCFIVICLLNSIAIEAKQQTEVLKKSSAAEKKQRHLTPLLLEIKLNESLLPGITQAYKDPLGHIWIDANQFRQWHM